MGGTVEGEGVVVGAVTVTTISTNPMQLYASEIFTCTEKLPAVVGVPLMV